MRQHHKNVLVIVALIGMVIMSIGAQDKVISVKQLQEQMPIGMLGEPLGQHLIIEGSYIEAMANNPIEVTIVNGKPISKPVVIELRRIDKIQPGTIYRLEGYESGAFEGDPFSEVAQQPFQYKAFFVVTKILKHSSK